MKPRPAANRRGSNVESKNPSLCGRQQIKIIDADVVGEARAFTKEKRAIAYANGQTTPIQNDNTDI